MSRVWLFPCSLVLSLSVACGDDTSSNDEESSTSGDDTGGDPTTVTITTTAESTSPDGSTSLDESSSADVDSDTSTSEPTTSPDSSGEGTTTTDTAESSSGETTSAITVGTESSTTDPSETDTDATSTDTDTGGQTVVVECGDLVPPAQGTCEVTSVGTSGVILRGDVLGAGTTLHGGSVFVDGHGVIACVDCDCSGVLGAADASVVTCADAVISPGLINPHDHITYANNEPIGNGVDRYEHRHDWREGQNGHAALPYNSGASTAVVQAAEFRFLMGGATATAGAGGRAGLLRNLDMGTAELEGITIRPADSDTFPLDDADGTTDTNGCDYGNNPTTATDIEGLDGYLPHISEGINLAANNEFICTSMGETDLIESQSAVIHAVGIVPDDVAEMSTEMAKVVWSPRSNVVLYGNTAPVTMLDNMGVAIALGTDWVPSGSMNLLRELRCAADLNTNWFGGHFTDEQLWRMVTQNAAFATGADQAIGMLRTGMVGDVTIFANSGSVDHAAVVDAELEDVVLVLRGGTAMYGDADLLASAVFGGAACETLDVCGSSKRACLDLANGATVASIQTAIENYYPLFFCEEPIDEPSCVPFRTEYPNGITMDDLDGDGIENASDNCSLVFNPIRDLEAAQGDDDSDGVGDVCDACPLDADDACGLVDANDFDDDGIGNASDNCPYDANNAQADGDADGHGDACDTCAAANPGASVCPVSIPALRDPTHPEHPGEGTAVAIGGAYVTAVRPNSGGSRGFYVQEDTLMPYSGIFVYTGSQPPNVQVGNLVAVEGTYDEFFELSEIVATNWVVLDAGTALPFDPIDFADPSQLVAAATAEPWESMLVSVGPVSVTVQNPDNPQDFDEFTVTGGLRIDDQIFDGTVGAGLGNDCIVGSEFPTIVGIEGFSFANYKLQPRDATDIVVTTCQPYP